MHKTYLKMKKRLIIAIALISLFYLVFPNALAFEMPSVVFSASLPKTSFSAGENIDISIYIINGQNPLIDGTLVIRLVQLNDNKEIKNTLVENIITDLNLRVDEDKNLQHFLVIPSYAAPGNYRVDIYLLTPRMFIKGIPHLSYAGLSYDVFVVNEQDYRSVRVDIEKTTVCGKLDLFISLFPDAKPGDVEEGCFNKQFGPKVAPISIVKGNVILVNDGNQDEQNLKVRWKVYNWDDILGKLISEQEYDLELLSSGEERTILVEFIAPELPSAYSIRIEVEDSEGKLLSLHQSRIVVEDVGSRIKLLTLNKQSYAAGDTVVISTSAAAPPDATSELKGQRRLIVKDNINNEIVFDKKERMNIEPNTLSEKVYEFQVQRELSDFTITFSVLDSDENLLDKRSIHLSPSIFERFMVIKAEFFSDLSNKPDDYFAPGKVFVKASALDDLGKELNIPIDMFYSFDKYNIGPVKVSGVEELQLKEGIYEFLFRAEGTELKKEIIISSEPRPITKKVETAEEPKAVEKPEKGKLSMPLIIALVFLALLIIAFLIARHRRGNEI